MKQPDHAVPEPAPEPASEAIATKRPGGFALVAKFVGLTLAAVAVPAAITIAVPEVNDYARATLIKQKQLARPASGRIALVGGSNLAFGIDSARIERATGCRVANMGLNGYFGVRYMLNEVEPPLKSGDLVVIALEYDSFFKSVDGTATDLITVAKANPRALAYMTPGQQFDMATMVPMVAQEKLSRLIHEMLGKDEADESPSFQLIAGVESAAGYEYHGDNVAHLGIKWPYGREFGVDMNQPRDPGLYPLLKTFVDRMNRRGVRVMISFTPVMRAYYERYRGPIHDIYTEMSAREGLPVGSDPANYVFETGQMFDTVYHLNAGGMRVRTDRLIGDLENRYGNDLHCNPPVASNQYPKGTSHE